MNQAKFALEKAMSRAFRKRLQVVSYTGRPPGQTRPATNFNAHTEHSHDGQANSTDQLPSVKFISMMSRKRPAIKGGQILEV